MFFSRIWQPFPNPVTGPQQDLPGSTGRQVGAVSERTAPALAGASAAGCVVHPGPGGPVS